jgi:hypothetical protein
VPNLTLGYGNPYLGTTILCISNYYQIHLLSLKLIKLLLTPPCKSKNFTSLRLKHTAYKLSLINRTQSYAQNYTSLKLHHAYTQALHPQLPSIAHKIYLKKHVITHTTSIYKLKTITTILIFIYQKNTLSTNIQLQAKKSYVIIVTQKQHIPSSNRSDPFQ